MKLDRIFEIVNVVVGTKLFFTSDPALEREDVIQDLALHVLEMDLQGKVRSDNEAWVIAVNALKNMFRDWSSEPTTVSLDVMLKDAAEGVMSYDDLLHPTSFEEIEELALSNIMHEQAKPAFDMLAQLDNMKGNQLKTLHVKVVGNEIAQATRLYRQEVRDIEEHGYTPTTYRDKRRGVVFVMSRITYPFLARLTKALIALGTTPRMAIKVVRIGLRAICNKCDTTEEDSQLLRDYRRRAGANITWEKHPRGDMTLTRGNLRLFIEV